MVDHDPADQSAETSNSGDADPTDGRDESQDERMDRNWNEMLQELRVTQTGTQILTGFLLAIAFQNRFEDLTTFQHRVYLILVLAAVTTTALGLAPVSLHRELFRQHAKGVVVKIAHVLLRLTLLGVGLVLVGTVLLIFDVAVDRESAWIAAGTTFAIIAIIAALPQILRRARPEEFRDTKVGK
ncbi:MAG TPA: DUF6328 family protein [Propionibacteriaceae bacterium]|nr:DUF6328 family protein [Propionibacteriaceae bacterium]